MSRVLSVVMSTARKGKVLEAKWRRKDQFTLLNIALTLKPLEQEYIYRYTMTRDAWNSLKEIYEGKGIHRFLSLLKSISVAKLEDGMKVKDYIQEV